MKNNTSATNEMAGTPTSPCITSSIVFLSSHEQNTIDEVIDGDSHKRPRSYNEVLNGPVVFGNPADFNLDEVFLIWFKKGLSLKVVNKSGNSIGWTCLKNGEYDRKWKQRFV